MKYALALVALLASAPAMGQNGGIPPDTRPDRSHAGTCWADGCPAPTFYIPDRWWVDMDQRELPCDRYPPADQWMRPMCIEKVRGEK